MALSSTIPLETRISIDYLDSEGSLTHRTIYPLSRYMRHGSEYLRAFCSLRGEERTFRMDRIRSWKRETESAQLFPGEPLIVTKKESKFSPLTPKVHPELPAAGSQNGTSEYLKVTRTSDSSGLWSVIVGIGIILAFSGYASKDRPIKPAPIVIPVPAPVTPVVVQPKTDPAPLAEETPVVPSVPVCGECADRFRSVTRIDNPSLEAIYAAADYDKNGTLSWRELQIFQNWMKQRFVYRSNELALPPDRFLEEGGGDCEDWALFTCGMLRYWGWDAYLGTAGPHRRRRNSSGHAFTFVRVDEVPEGFAWFEVTPREWGFRIPSGKYVPVDYDVVGGYSNAVRGKWIIDGISTPEENYGVRM
jgi:hypothetical protein